MGALCFEQPGVAEPGAPQPGGRRPSRAPYLPGVEAGRANRRDTDELVELAADQGERGLNGGAGRGRAQVGQIPAFRAAGGVQARNRAEVLKPWLIRTKARYAYPCI